MAPTADPTTVPGLPESTLAPEHLSALPTDPPAAPWNVRARALIWLHRGPRPDFDWLGAAIPLSLVCFVEYLDTPVGPYREVLAGNLVRAGRTPRLQVPFIAVDSLASVAGGRVNWALPKTMATFDLDLAAGSARAEGPDWAVRVRPARDGGARAQRLPIRSRFSSVGPLGSYRTRMRAGGRVLRVHTEAEGPTLTGWLGRGSHLAVSVTGRMQISPPSGR